jgi:hypothetical protein
MGATTPNLALPYPVPADTVDVPRDMLALATKLDNYSAIAPARVTVLPVAPVDGQEIYFQSAAMAPLGVIWRLRYNSASASAYKWEFVGGGDLGAEVATLEGTASTGYTNLATVGPDVLVPLAGEYMITLSASIIPPAVNDGAGAMSYQFGATPASDGDAIVGQTPAATATMGATCSRLIRRTLATAGVTISARYRSAGTAGTAQFSRRSLVLRPVRVG